MTKIFNKLFYYVKNLALPFLMFATVYIVMMMFQRLGKEPFGANFFEFIEVILPYILLIILLLVNTFLHQDEVRNNMFYNLTSFLVMLTIFVFCYRALFDKNLILWHKLKYDIDFNYFTDQIAPMKTLLYLLSAANIILIVKGCIKDDEELKEETKVIEPKEEIKDDFKELDKEEELKNDFKTLDEEDNFKVSTEETEVDLPKEEDIDVSLDIKKDNNTNNNNNQHKNKNYYNNNKNKKNNYYKNNNNNYYKKNNNKPKQNNNNQNNDQNKQKKTFDFYE